MTDRRKNTIDDTAIAGRVPQKQGLYDPRHEKDACGVGFCG